MSKSRALLRASSSLSPALKNDAPRLPLIGCTFTLRRRSATTAMSERRERSSTPAWHVATFNFSRAESPASPRLAIRILPAARAVRHGRPGRSQGRIASSSC